MRFEWDAAKAARNRRKHGVSFEEASEVFRDRNAVVAYDAEHSTAKEDRFVRIGYSGRPRMLCVVFTERYGDTTRIISARKATAGEAAEYARARG